MLVIRSPQMEAFREARMKAFEVQMVGHLRESFPEEMEGKDDDALRRFVRAGIARAEGHGVSRPAGFCCFIDMQVVLGDAFDTDPKYPWAAETLRNEAIGDPDARAEALAHIAVSHLEAMERGAA